MNGQRVAHTLTLLLFFICVIVVIPLWALITWKTLPHGLEFESSFSDRQVHAGHVIVMRGTVSVPPGCRVLIVRRAIDSSGTIVHSSIARFAYRPGERSQITLADIMIPPTALPGNATLVRIMEWRCNWLQELIRPTVDLEPLHFTILPAGETSWMMNLHRR